MGKIVATEILIASKFSETSIPLTTGLLTLAKTLLEHVVLQEFVRELPDHCIDAHYCGII
jgi:hypothetical protein